MRDEREQFAGTKISHETLIPYKQQRKPLMNKEERERQARSLVTYRPGGDAS